MPRPAVDPAVVVVDCGAHTVKAGVAGETNPRVVIPTCTATVKGQVTKRIGDQVAELKADPSLVTVLRAHDRGHVTNIACLEAVLSRSFDQDHLGVTPSSSSLFMSEALFTPGPVGQAVDELVFEYYGFQSHARSPCAPWWTNGLAEAHPKLSAVARGASCSLVVETGFSATTITPVVCGRVLSPAVRRVDIAGKAMTNYLKEILSYRQLNVMDDTRTVEHVKEQLAVVSLDFVRDLTQPGRGQQAMFTTRPPAPAQPCIGANGGADAGVSTGDGVANEEEPFVCCSSMEANGEADAAGDVLMPMRREYVLPDFRARFIGYARPCVTQQRQQQDAQTTPEAATAAAKAAAAAAAAGSNMTAAAEGDEQCLVLENERLATAELLFNPGDIGLRQAGVSEAVMQSVFACDEALRGQLLNNIVVVGGSSKLPNFRHRLFRDVRASAPSEFSVSVVAPADPILGAWRGGAALGMEPSYFERAVTRAEYDEQGHRVMLQRQHDTCFWDDLAVGADKPDAMDMYGIMD
eukprot:g1203.t1